MMKTLLFLLFASLTSNADFKLRSLKNVSIQSFDFNQSHPSIYMVFQEDCTACSQQVQKFSCLNWPVYLLGAFSTEKSLRKEYLRMKTKYPAYLANDKVLKKLGASEGLTPQTVILTETKKYHFLGLTSCEKIKSNFKNEI